MKITAFDPIIVSPDVEAVKKVFEALGFEKTHAPSNTIADKQVTSYRMKHPNGYHVDVVGTSENISRDKTLIRMNVDDFEEVYNILLTRGYKNVHGDRIDGTCSSTFATMEAPSGFRISIVKHIRDHE